MIPDFAKDPRRKARALKALDLAYELMLAPSGRKSIPAVELREILGTQAHPFSAYLHTLFQKCGNYTVNGATYQYEAIEHRVQRLEELVINRNGFFEYARAHGKSFDTAPTPEMYTWVGDRRYAWWTNMRKDLREKLFLESHQVMYDYDIQAAAPTLLLQAWKRWMIENKPFIYANSQACKVPTWSELVINRTAFRQRFSLECGISIPEAKAVIQIVLNSGIVTGHCAGSMKDLSRETQHRIMASPMYQGLRADFKTMWSHWSALANGQTAGEALSRMYCGLERKVMAVIEEKVQSPCWFVHDGFMSTENIDVNELEREIELKTGYVIKLEQKVKEARASTAEQPATDVEGKTEIQTAEIQKTKTKRSQGRKMKSAKAGVIVDNKYLSDTPVMTNRYQIIADISRNLQKSTSRSRNLQNNTFQMITSLGI